MRDIAPDRRRAIGGSLGHAPASRAKRQAIRRDAGCCFSRIAATSARVDRGALYLTRIDGLSVWLAIIARVPRISEFYGIVIEMYYGDHPPPHFHARYGEDAAKIEIATGELIAGSLPGRAVRLVREWVEAHRGELEANWERAVRHERPEQIEPLR
jgi:Domain of unknown function (DUF4160)